MMKKLFFFFDCVLSLACFSQDIDVLHYKFSIGLQDSIIKGESEITIKFLESTHNFSLDLDQQMRLEKIVDLSKKKISDDNVRAAQRRDKIMISILDNVQVGEIKTFKINYFGIPKDGLIISRNKYEDKTFFADNWPNRAHYWIPCNDRPDDKASFEFIVTAPSQYIVVSNGVKVEEKYVGNDRKLSHWKEDTPLPTKVMVIGAAKFAVKTFEDSPANIPVSAWVYQQDSSKGFHDYAPATEILKFFSNYIAPYPYKKLANVQSKTIFGGMENASAIFYSENSVTGKGGVEDLLAHEIAHQWFGDMASEKSFAHLWLSEGFATYFTNIYWQHKFGKEAFRKRLQKERAEVIEFVKTNDRPVVDSLSPYMDLLNVNSYQKGGWILHMLRNEIGDSLFHKIIQTYYQQYKGGNADTRDFESVAEKVSGKNLKWFFDQWLYRPGIPQLLIDRDIDKDEVKLRITQQGVKFDFPLEIAIIRTDGSSLKETIPVNSQMIEYKIKVPDIKSVIIDPDTKLLFAELKN